MKTVIFYNPYTKKVVKNVVHLSELDRYLEALRGQQITQITVKDTDNTDDEQFEKLYQKWKTKEAK